MKILSTSVIARFSRIAIFCLFFVTAAAFAKAQGVSIKAKIVDRNGALLSGEVHVLSSVDSTLMKGAAFTNGFVHIVEIPEAPSYVVKILAEGFREHVTQVTPNSGSFDLGTVTLEKVTVQQAAQVIGKTKIFRQTAEGGTKINVENTMLSSSISSKEILTKSPGVSLVGNRAFLFGKGEALLFLNGKPTTYERLLSIPVTSIKEVEIIPNPSAKYDARGRAVINVIMKKNDQQGWQGSVTHNSTFAVHYAHSYATDLSFREKKFNAQLSYGSDLGKDWNRTFGNYLYHYPSGDYVTYTHYVANIKIPGSHTYRVGLGYDISDKTDISAQYEGLYSLNLLDVKINNQYYNPAGTRFDTYVNNNASTRLKNNSVNLNLNHRIDTLGSTFFIGAQNNWFVNNLDDNIKEEGKPPFYRAYRHNQSKNTIQLFTAQADWVKVMKDGSKFETGVKYADANTHSKIDVLSRLESNPDWTPIDYLKNNFQYSEKVGAMYMQYSGKLSKKVSYNAGLRAEQSDVDGYSIVNNKKVIDSTYFNLFPNIKLDYAINDNWSASANFSRHISRPFYQDLDPFLWYQDSLTLMSGNPYLLPELITSYDIALNYKNFGFKFGYASSKNYSRNYPKKGPAGPNSVIYYRENMEHTNIFTASLDYNVEKGNFSSYNKVAMTHLAIDDSRPLFFQVRKVLPVWYFYSYSQYKIPKLFTVDLLIDYTSKATNGITMGYPLYYAAAGISRNFLDKRLSVRLLWNDFLRTYTLRTERDVAGIFLYLDQRGNTNFGRITMTYKFGKLKNANYKNKAVNEAEFNRIRK